MSCIFSVFRIDAQLILAETIGTQGDLGDFVDLVLDQPKKAMSQ